MNPIFCRSSFRGRATEWHSRPSYAFVGRRIPQGTLLSNLPNLRSYSNQNQTDTWKYKLIDFLGFTQELEKHTQKRVLDFNKPQTDTPTINIVSFPSQKDPQAPQETPGLPLTPSPATPAPSEIVGPSAVDAFLPKKKAILTMSIKERNDEEWPPAPETWPAQWLILCAGLAIYILYSHFAASESYLEEMADELRWGGEYDQLRVLGKLNTYLKMEDFGAKVSYKIWKMGLLDELLGVLSVPRSERVREEAMKVLCKLTANNSEIRVFLLDEGILDILRLHADPYNIYVLYTLANLSLQKYGTEKILKDSNLLDSISYTLAYSLKAGRFEDRFIQRAIMMVVNNIFQHTPKEQIPTNFMNHISNLLTLSSTNLAIDPFTLVYYVSVLGKITDSAPSLKTFVPFLPDVSPDISISAHQVEKSLSLMLGSSCVLSFSFLFAYLYQRYYFLAAKYPLTLYQSKWARKQILRTPLVAVFFFLARYLVDEMSAMGSDYLAFHPDDHRDPRTAFGGSFAWEQPKTKATSAAMSVHVMLLPIYYLGLRFSYYSLIPSLIPWKVASGTPPEYLLKALPSMRLLYDVFFHPPGVPEPTLDDINTLREGQDPMSLMLMQQILAMNPELINDPEFQKYLSTLN
eukprot:TRINITY_DN4368_c0_g1_i1.p1 TRINITY_DN4368_c0_g1~~TRINITY_DN4368_c0_g1_i1.p1  ORF type:complete len:632 (-),score=109.81 TRINITY_DN4368_c0_g1_i1:8-1903(-)